mmetsp:Transcript_2943/g.6871  ORF Transcript_2943/g.6871 Transcript_2943/m.6871 type:complete len:397 (+) Transcript_2943:71-1261(+)
MGLAPCLPCFSLIARTMPRRALCAVSKTSAASATSLMTSYMRLDAAWWSRQYCLQTRSNDAQKLVYSSSLCSKRCLSALLLAAKFTSVSVCSFICASFCTVPSMLAQKAEQPCRISSTRLSSRSARNSEAAEFVMASAAVFSAAEGMNRTIASSAPAGCSALSLLGGGSLGFSVGDMTSSAHRSSGGCSGASALKPNCPILGSCEGCSPGAMKRSSSTSRFQVSSSASLAGTLAKAASLWLKFCPSLAPAPLAWLSCSKSCRVQTFMEKGTFNVPLVASGSAGLACFSLGLSLALAPAPSPSGLMERQARGESGGGANSASTACTASARCRSALVLACWTRRIRPCTESCRPMYLSWISSPSFFMLATQPLTMPKRLTAKLGSFSSTASLRSASTS